MKKLWLLILPFILIFLISCNTKYKENRLYCEFDSDCICGGVDRATNDCFFGNKDYYDIFVEKDVSCPDFCEGPDEDIELRCANNTCMKIRIEEPGRLALKADKTQGFAPLTVRLEVDVIGFVGHEEEYYCQAYEWKIGEQSFVENPTCEPYLPGIEVPSHYGMEYVFDKPGKYLATFAFPFITSNALLITVNEFRSSSSPKTQCLYDYDCRVGGCSGQICGLKDEVSSMATTCEIKAEYVCYKLTSCGCVDEKCQWIDNEAFNSCLGRYR